MAGHQMALLVLPEEQIVAVAVRAVLGRFESSMTAPWLPPDDDE